MQPICSVSLETLTHSPMSCRSIILTFTDLSSLAHIPTVFHSMPSSRNLGPTGPVYFLPRVAFDFTSFTPLESSLRQTAAALARAPCFLPRAAQILVGMLYSGSWGNGEGASGAGKR